MADILMLVEKAPCPAREDGYTLRFHHVLTYLGHRHAVDLIVCGDDRPDAADWARHAGSICRRVETAPRHPMAAWRRATRILGGMAPPGRVPWEAIRPWTADCARLAARALVRTPYAALLAADCADVLSLLPRRPGHPPRTVLDWVDSPTLLHQRAANGRRGGDRFLARLRLTRIRRWEARLNRGVDAAVYVAEPDRQTANRPDAPNVFVIPNGVEAAPPSPPLAVASPVRPRTLGFLGNMSYRPNILAARRLHDRVFQPLRERFPDLRLKIIGRSPDPVIEALRSDRVEVTGAVDEIWPHLAEVDVMVFPLETGAGLQNKILESIAAGRPVVATSLSAAGCGAETGGILQVADSDEELRTATTALLADEAHRRFQAEQARQLLARFAWDPILARYEGVLLG